GRWQLVNTADGSYAPSPNIYYAYAILSRYAPRGGRLRRLTITAPDGRAAFIHGVAIEYANDLTVLLVNDQPGEVIVVDLPAATERPLSAWQTDATHKHRAVSVEQR